MRKIYGIGETVFDIIFKDGQPQAAKPGGSVLNSLVSLGRMQLPVSFISEYARDDVGTMIDDFLKNNGIDTSLVYRFDDGKTTLALAFLNENNDARYSFYHYYPEKRLGIRMPGFKEDDILTCGSFYAITPGIRGMFRALVESARDKGVLILYDPNFRKSHLSELKELMPYIAENMQMAEIVRGSHEDFANIFDARNAGEAYEAVKPFCKTLVYTDHMDGVTVKSPSFSGKFPVRKLNPVSTIGAGDNFNAGMITALYLNQIPKKTITTMGGEEWGRLISTAVDFASHVCLSYENYISSNFAKKIMEG